MPEKMSDEQYLVYLKRKYEELDANGDGKVSLLEFTQNTQGCSKELREFVWDHFNSNRDQGLSFEEYLASQGNQRN
ncbi:hypothetical protein HU755_25700 [Pseudomonas sp. SWRI111]|uniref:hypothetical protein n=1 Tax=unclassified Pseudomonas TaxID=196821 RepID=UPI001645D3E9|nr:MULTISPECIES: hypothetical protein [unclassified Pseudomonas]MBC3210207.1 hypothetical protein [Pseudomonas sp. SWRI111]MBC3271122.1 hypothetical protein [Pseudomonas sp. SWRI81]